MAIPPLGVLKISCRARVAAAFSVFPYWNRPAQHAILAVSEDRGNRAYFSIDLRGGNLRFTPTPGAGLMTRAPHAQNECTIPSVAPRVLEPGATVTPAYEVPFRVKSARFRFWMNPVAAYRVVALDRKYS